MESGVSDWPDNPRSPDGPPVELLRRALNEVLSGIRKSDIIVALYDFLELAHLCDNTEYFALRLPQDLETSLPDEQVVRFLKRPAESISDGDRAAFIRHAVKNIMTVPEGLLSVHWLKVTISDELSFFLGCLVDAHEGSEPELHWQGGFETVEIFYTYLRSQGILLRPDDVDTWSDARLLGLWNTTDMTTPSGLH